MPTHVKNPSISNSVASVFRLFLHKVLPRGIQGEAPQVPSFATKGRRNLVGICTIGDQYRYDLRFTQSQRRSSRFLKSQTIFESDMLGNLILTRLASMPLASIIYAYTLIERVTTALEELM